MGSSTLLRQLAKNVPILSQDLLSKVYLLCKVWTIRSQLNPLRSLNAKKPIILSKP